jgi:predicted GNAT superfamily acetyltransferase
VTSGEIRIEPLTTDRQFTEAVALQKTIWGFDDIDLLPVRLFIVATKVGGQAFGAYAGRRMVGFCLAIPGLKPGGRAYLHSHMAGVLPEYQNAGIGRRLKLRQRDDAIARGIDLLEWTFDPLELRNAHFNLERLGAIVRRYVRNQYGISSSHLHGGLPTDRCVAEWWINSERVQKIVNGELAIRGDIVERIPVPSNIAEIRRSAPNRARAIQKELAGHFEGSFARGLAAVGLDRDPEWGTYLLGAAD